MPREGWLASNHHHPISLPHIDPFTMPFNQNAFQASNIFGIYNDIQGDQYNVMIYQSHTSGTSQLPLSLSEATLRDLHKLMLPSPPKLMIGRENEKANIIDTLLRRSPARVAISGVGGIGKTTMALSILHEPSIVNQYPSRYFIACEGVLSISSLVEEIANALQIPPANRHASLIDTISSSFPDKTLLCFDNFETLWDNEAMRPDIEKFLSALQHTVLGLIITMQGTELPSKVSWSKPFLPPLRPLTGDVPKRIFEGMTGGSVDTFAEKLLIAAGGIPLAISLISALLREGNESPRSLWNRWTELKGLESGGEHRLSNLDTSIHLSVYGPRTGEDPTTIDILAMLSVLPDGFPDDERMVEELQSHLPDGYDLEKALLTLRRVSLVHVDEAAVPRRLRILSPIISFCQRTSMGSEDLRNSLTSFYVQMMNRFPDCTHPDGHAIIRSELHNIHMVLMEAWRRGKGDASVTVASIQFTLWSTYLGNPVEEVVCEAMRGVVGEPNLLGDCHFAVGLVRLRRNELDDAEASFKRAAELHRQAHDGLGEGTDLQKLGELHLRRDELDDAEAMFKHASELHRQAKNVLGEGNDLQNLGKVHLRREELDEAEVMFKRATELHRQAQNVLGEGNDLQNLGEVYLRRGKLNEAEAMFKRARKLHQQAHDVLGEGNDLQNLGKVYLQRGELDKAEAMFKRANELHRQTGNVRGEGNGLRELAGVHLEQNKPDEAEAILKRAINLHQQAHDVDGEANDLLYLGGLHSQRYELDEAEAMFKRASELHRQGGSVSGAGNALRHLGLVHWKRDELDEAEAMFKHAIELHQQAHDVLSEGTDLRHLGEVYLPRKELDKAEEIFKRAIELHRRARHVTGEAVGLQKLGEVHLEQDELDKAEAVLKRATELHRQTHNIVDEGLDLQHLGEVYLRRGELDEAEVVLKRASMLHEVAQDVLGEGNALHNLGEVYLRQGELDEAEEMFKRAAKLHWQAHDVYGEAADLRRLGEVHDCRGELDEAEAVLKHAIELDRQAHNIFDEGTDLLRLGKMYFYREELDKAEAMLKRANELHRQTGNVRGEVDGLRMLGHTHSCRDEQDEANAMYERATELEQQPDDEERNL